MQKIIETGDFFKQLVENERQNYASANNANDENVAPQKKDQEITVCVRYRPLLAHELAQGNFCCATLRTHDSITLHKPEFSLTAQPTLVNETITVDMAFGEKDSNDIVYSKTARNLIPLALGGGVGTLFAYGQTSSGKTHTLVGIEEYVAKEIFDMAEEYQQKFSAIPLPSPESLLPPSTSTTTTSKYLSYQNKRGSSTSKPAASATKKLYAPRSAKPSAAKKETQEAQTEQVEKDTPKEATQPLSPEPSQIQQKEPTLNQPEQKEQTEQEKRKLRIYVSFFELLGKNSYDLLANKKPIAILEDKFGEIQLSGIEERQIFSTEEFVTNIRNAAEQRQSATTLRNDSSSRSHAVCRVRFNNPLFPSSQDGLLMLVDLAGSERAADSKDHSADRLAETREINTSLMSLKDCIRARATASNATDKFVHVPYRSSKLTVLLKDAFELSSMRPTQTIVIAHVSPCATDVPHSLNTLRYVAPLKVRPGKPVVDPKNPATWTHEQMVQWIKETYNGRVDPSLLCPFESGLQLCKIPEAEYMRRILLNPGISEKLAKKFYMSLWEEIVDARTRKRQESMKLDKAKQVERMKRLEEEGRDLIERSRKEGVKLD